MPTKNLTQGKETAVGLALAYPFPLPKESYLLTEEGAQPLPQYPDKNNLIPVLACGSNQSPDQLLRKFSGMLVKDPIPVTKGILHSFDVAYSAHFSNYGSIPASLVEAQGTSVSLAVTWLTKNQLIQMHKTEALGQNYAYGKLKKIDLEFENARPLDEVFTYVSLRGLLLLESKPIPLGEITATGRDIEGVKQRDVQLIVQQILSPQESLSDFIANNIEDDALRNQRNFTLNTYSKPFTCDKFHLVQGKHTP